MPRARAGEGGRGGGLNNIHNTAGKAKHRVSFQHWAHTDIGAFSVAGPMTWDSLPRHLRDPVHNAFVIGPLQARTQTFWKGDSFSLPFGPFLPFPSLSFLSRPLPSYPLEVGPLNPARESGGALWAPPAGSRAEPQPKSNLVHFSHKIWPLVATFSMIFFRINWPN